MGMWEYFFQEIIFLFAQNKRLCLYLHPLTRGPDGGTGRRARLKIVCLRACGFDSHSGYRERLLRKPFFIGYIFKV